MNLLKSHLVLSVILFFVFIKKDCQCANSTRKASVRLTIEKIPNQQSKKKRINPKILGGTHTDIELYPSIVALLENNFQMCGGTVVGVTTVLSAAHCFTSGNTYTIRSGSTYRSSGGKIHNVVKVILHYEFENVRFRNDFAIVKTVEAFDDFQIAEYMVVPLPGNSHVMAVGWGADEHYMVSEKLQHVQLVTLTNAQCQLKLKNYIIFPSMLCAGHIGGGKDTCTGDSGGPLYYRGKLAGVTSWGLNCGERYPGVYGNVSHIVDWIRSL